MNQQDLLQALANELTDPNPRTLLRERDLAPYPALIQLIEKRFQMEKAEGKLLLPLLNTSHNQSVFVFSDFGGEHSKSLYRTYSFLVFAWNHAAFAQDEFRKIRTQYGLGTSEIAFKKLREARFENSINEYLRVCDFIPGMLLTIAVAKGVTNLFRLTPQEQTALNERYAHGGRPRSKPDLEKMLRVAHTSAYLLGWLSHPGQAALWMTDNDNIVANDQIASRMYEYTVSVLPKYCDHKLERLGYTRPETLDCAENFQDFLSVTDLAAGAIESHLTHGGDERLPSKGDNVLSWLGRHSIGLKKYSLLIEKSDQDDLQCCMLRFRDTSSSEPPLRIGVQLDHS